MLKLWVVLALACAGAPAATRVVILGTGTPRADPSRSGPAVALIYNGRAHLFDSGPGVVRRAAAAAGRLKIAALQAPSLNRVFLTHLHPDHTLGLPDPIFTPGCSAARSRWCHFANYLAQKCARYLAYSSSVEQLAGLTEEARKRLRSVPFTSTSSGG